MSQPQLIVLCGLPGSGKTEYAERMAYTYDAMVVNSTDMRESFLEDPDDRSPEGLQRMYRGTYDLINNILSCKTNVIYDATNLSRENRMDLLTAIKYPCHKKCVLIVRSYTECVENNNKYEVKIPISVIDNLYKSFQTPCYQEGFDEIEIIQNGNDHIAPENLITAIYDFEQDDPSHPKALGDHLMHTASRVFHMRGYDKTLCYAALLHDIGKPYTKTFFDREGVEVPFAKYYSHHNVGAYDSLMVDVPDTVDKLEMSLIICLHMAPFFWKNEEEIERFKRNYGEDIYDRVMCLHAADQLER